jgi:hypothetical protein
VLECSGMRAIVVALSISIVACATGPDTRPETADYIIEAILVPYCGRGGCHSSETRARNMAFDTIAGSKAALQTSQRGQTMVVAGSPQGSRLFTVLIDSNRIMPPDVPLPQADIDLIAKWITDGAQGLP